LGSAINIGNINYQTFIYPGILAMSVLFSSVFFGIYIVWDRKIDILKEVLVAPISRTSIFIGKVLGGCTDSMVQALVMLFIGFFVGVYFTPLSFFIAFSILFLLSLKNFLSSLGFVVFKLLSVKYVNSFITNLLK